MPTREPTWWYKSRWNLLSAALLPASALYGRIAARRVTKQPVYRSKLPILCVGNFTVGGTGKTPLSIALADMVRQSGGEPVFLSRGYGGAQRGPLLIDAHHTTAHDAGDEPLLLARAAPTIIARDRVAGVRVIERDFPPETVVIMDDGLQNPALDKTFCIGVVDVRRRFGNGRCLPAGPLRAPLKVQLPRVNLILLTGEASEAEQELAIKDMTHRFDGPVLRAQVAPAGDLLWLRGANVLAFAGIANPSRFFDLLEANGARLADKRVFPDHHPFSDADAASLLTQAESLGARLVTTEKDFVRLYGHEGARGGLRERAMTVPVTMVLQDKDHTILESRISEVIASAAAKQSAEG